MTDTIIMDNAVSLVQTDDDTIRQLKSRVSYREKFLPPPHVQQIIKQYVDPSQLKWSPMDILFNGPAAGVLWSLGWGTNRLTDDMIAEVVMSRGTWDGWHPQVSDKGWFGTGLVPMVERVLKVHMGRDVRLIDRRERPASNPPGTLPELWDHQQEAVDQFFMHGGRGVMNVPPRCGKTRIGIAVVKSLMLPTIVIVPTRALVDQTVAAYEPYFEKGQVVGITGGAPKAKDQARINQALVWIVTPPTAAGPNRKGPGGEKFARQGLSGIETRRVLILDEFHHAASDTWTTISWAARKAYYRLGLTGTHYRADGKDLAMHAVLSRSVYKRSISDMVRLGFLVPAKIAMLRVTGTIAATKGHAVYSSGVVEHEHRNALVAWSAQQLMASGRKVIVIAKEVNHSKELAGAIGFGSVQVDGQGEDSAAQVKAAVKMLGSGLTSCVVGTSVIGEGVDVPNADALVYAAGGSSKVKVVQDYFRVLTAKSGKSCGIIVDLADNHNDKLIESSARRLALYRSESAFQSDVLDPSAFHAWLERAA